jgi:hypothetical protein
MPISPFGAAHVAAALAALAGAAVVVIGAALRLPSIAVTIVGALLCFGVRFMAIRRGWHLPVVELGIRFQWRVSASERRAAGAHTEN